MPEFGQSMAVQRRRGMDAVNAAVGDVRRAYITAIPGQEMIYSAKEAEARAFFAADPEPEDLSAFPMMASEIGITAPTARQLAEVWLYMAALWRGVAAALEPVRLRAVSSVEAATSAAEIASALEAMRSDLENLK